jgi:arylsulfatase A-like enzyme
MGTSPRKVKERVENIDLAPTLCELAGCQLGPYPTGQAKPDGRSFAPILLGTSKILWRGSVLHSFRRAGARVPRWWGIETTRYSTAAGMGCSSKKSNGCLWSYVKYETGEKELYDLRNGPCYTWKWGQPGDPCRLNNLAGKKKYQYVQRWLNRRLDELKK